MNNWTFFQTLLGQLTGILQTGGDLILNGSLGYARPLVLVCIIAWIAFKAIMVANSFETWNSIYRDLTRAAVVVFLLQSVTTYNQYVGTIAAAIPTEVGNAISGGAGNGNIANGAAFDTVWNAAAKAGLAVFDQVPKYSLSSIPLWIAVIVYLAIALIAIGVSFLVYLASTVLLLLLLKIGPLFVALFAFPIAAKFASGWVAAVVSAILTQVFAVAILILFIGTEQATIVSITQGGISANFIGEIVTLGEAALLMWLIATLVRQAPSFAASIAGGVYQNVSAMAGAAGTTASAVKQAGGWTKQAGQTVGTKVQAFRMQRAIVRSLSED